MPDQTTSSVCAGCGAPLPPSRSSINPRKWCSTRCRKRQYDKPCIDCGVPTDGTTPSRKQKRCRSCAAIASRGPRPKTVAHRQAVEDLWAEGKTLREICEILGQKFRRSELALWRKRGYDLPYRRSAEQRARMAANGGNFASARRVWQEQKGSANA